MNTPDSVRAAIHALNELGVPYMIVGSLSSNIYGIPRSTVGADIVIQSDEQIDRIREKLNPHFRAEPQLGFEKIGMTTKHLFYHRHSAFMLELFVLSNEAFDQTRFERRVRLESEGMTLVLPTAEDVVVQKLRWGRLKALADVEEVLKAQHTTLDWPYIHQWCQSVFGAQQEQPSNHPRPFRSGATHRPGAARDEDPATGAREHQVGRGSGVGCPGGQDPKYRFSNGPGGISK